MKSKVFDGTPSTAALLSSFAAGPSLPLEGGVPLGTCLKTGRLVLFEPWMLKVLGIIHSTIFLIVGQKGYGKSATLKSLLIRLMGLQAGMDQFEQPVRMRSRISDRKYENGDPEYKKVTQFLRSSVVHLQNMRLNIFDPRMNMDELDILETAISVAEMAIDGHLTSFQPLMFQVGVHQMHKNFPGQISPEILSAVIRGLTKEDVDEYYRDIGDNTLQALMLDRETEEQVALHEKLQITLQQPSSLTEQEIAHDASLAASYLDQVLQGSYGSVFGGQQSLRDILTRRNVNLDWTGVNDRAQDLLEYQMMKWEDIGLRLNDLDIIPHIQGGDEEQNPFTKLMHVRAQAARVSKARQSHTADFRIAQYLNSFSSGGNAGDELSKLVETVMQGIGGYWIGRQPDSPPIRRILEQLKLSRHDIELIFTLPRYCFAIILPDRPPVFYQHRLTDIELPLVLADSASERMVQRRIVWKDREVKMRAAKLGYISVGE